MTLKLSFGDPLGSFVKVALALNYHFLYSTSLIMCCRALLGHQDILMFIKS